MQTPAPSTQPFAEADWACLAQASTNGEVSQPRLNADLVGDLLALDDVPSAAGNASAAADLLADLLGDAPAGESICTLFLSRVVWEGSGCCTPELLRVSDRLSCIRRPCWQPCMFEAAYAIRFGMGMCDATG